MSLSLAVLENFIFFYMHVLFECISLTEYNYIP